MKFVYCGYDFMLGTVRRLMADGHELIGIFTFPCDNVLNYNVETVALAEELKIPISFEKPREEDIELLRDRGAKVFFVAGYLYKIPNVRPAYGINIHPSLLPKGRCIMPIPHILMDHPEAAGFTIHKLAEKLDSGDIIHQVPLPLSSNETVETLSGRMALRAPEAMSKVMSDIETFWNNAKPQNESEATHYPPPDDAMRFLDWNLPLERLDKIARAFGHFGCLAQVGQNRYVVYAHDVRKENHTLTPGVVAAQNNDGMAVAANGGFFILKTVQKII